MLQSKKSAQDERVAKGAFPCGRGAGKSPTVRPTGFGDEMFGFILPPYRISPYGSLSLEIL